MRPPSPSLPAHRVLGTTAWRLATDRARLRTRLPAIVERPTVREALYVASPSLPQGLSQAVRYPELMAAGEKRSNTLVALERDQPLLAALERATSV